MQLAVEAVRRIDAIFAIEWTGKIGPGDTVEVESGFERARDTVAPRNSVQLGASSSLTAKCAIPRQRHG